MKIINRLIIQKDINQMTHLIRRNLMKKNINNQTSQEAINPQPSQGVIN